MKEEWGVTVSIKINKSYLKGENTFKNKLDEKTLGV